MSDPAVMTVREWAMRLRDLADSGPQMAEHVAQLMKQEVDKAIGEQKSVDGQRWEPRKLTYNNGRPRKDLTSPVVLANAAGHVSARGIGTVAVITLEGPEVFHHYGAGRAPRRAILPSGGIDKLGKALAVGCVEFCEEFMARRGRHGNSARGVKWGQGKAAAA